MKKEPCLIVSQSCTLVVSIGISSLTIIAFCFGYIVGFLAAIGDEDEERIFRQK
jgi:hypothetical protein